MKKVYIQFPVIELSADIYREEILKEMQMLIQHELNKSEWRKDLDIIAKKVFDRVLENLSNETTIREIIEKYPLNNKEI